ncbi:MAG TPA: Rid family detoxifying hydrolase [Candidatus Eremiobacteraceae bacterium]|nr:Rid family detoxifying hydrolase [Candidatus Eremiobacteraceae bacterium]
MKLIATPSAPVPVAAYSQATQARGLVFTAGQIGIDPASGALVEGLDAQTAQAFSNVGAVLQAAGLGPADVAKVTIFMTDLTQFGKVNAIYESFVGGHRPARSTVGVAALPLGALVEIEAIAVQP